MAETAKNTDLPSRLLGVSWGRAVLVFLSIQFVTGSLLALHYRPGIPAGYQSTLEIARVIPLGWLIRGIHRYCAYGSMVFALIHMFSVFYRRSFRGNPARGWALGNLLMFLVLGSIFTGLLLPLDVVGGCATRVVLSLLASIPAAGEAISGFLFGFTEGGDFDPYLFHVAHVSLFPLLLVLIFWGHRPGPNRHAGDADLRRLIFLGAVSAAVVGFISVYFPPGLGQGFDPLAEVYQDVHPAWIFMSVYLLVSYTSSPGPWVVLCLALALAWLITPLIDGQLISGSGRRILTGFWIIVALAVVLATILAYPLTGAG